MYTQFLIISIFTNCILISPGYESYESF